MTASLKASTLFVSIAAVFLIAFNTAAALAHKPEVTGMALSLTALVATFVMMVGVWNGLRAITKT